jgi:hypothetical protein
MSSFFGQNSFSHICYCSKFLVKLFKLFLETGESRLFIFEKCGSTTNLMVTRNL